MDYNINKKTDKISVDSKQLCNHSVIADKKKISLQSRKMLFDIAISKENQFTIVIKKIIGF